MGFNIRLRGLVLIRHITSIFIVFALVGCKPAQKPIDNTAEINRISAELNKIKVENNSLKAENIKLETIIKELEKTPEKLLNDVKASIAANDLRKAREAVDTMIERFGATPQLKTATSMIDQAVLEAERKSQLAKELDAQGFYAIKPAIAPVVGSTKLKVESLKFGERWAFDYHNQGDYHYRTPEKGSTYLLLNVTVESAEKNPFLPDLAVFVIDGKEMRRVSGFNYKFRRWQSYGSFIGLYHDFKNDFAHVSTVPFNAAASLSKENSKKPFAVVATGKNCHVRESVIGQPNLSITSTPGCASKEVLTVDDFKDKSGFQIISFFNKPKGI